MLIVMSYINSSYLCFILIIIVLIYILYVEIFNKKYNYDKDIDKNLETFVCENSNISQPIKNINYSKKIEDISNSSHCDDNCSEDSDMDDENEIKSIRENLWPYPANISKGDKYYIFNHYNIQLDDTEWKEYISILLQPHILDNPITDYNTYVNDLISGNSNYHPDKKHLKFKVSINKTCTRIGNLDKKNFHKLSSYQLNIDEKGNVSINAETYIGVGYALITLQQLIVPYKKKLLIKNLPLTIYDSPKIFYRETSIDTGRHYFNVSDIIKLVRNMAFNKLNFLRWHLCDNQSFPLNIGEITEILSKKQSKDSTFNRMTGAFSSSKNYNKQDIKKIIDTSFNYGITVIPCLDTPSHVASLMYGSQEATNNLFDLPIQVIKGWESLYQYSKKDYEQAVIVGYLDIGNSKNSCKKTRDKIVYLIYKILDEIISAFHLCDGCYGYIIDLGFRKTDMEIIEKLPLTKYMNAVLAIFGSKSSSIIDYLNNNVYKNGHKIVNNSKCWESIKIKMWIDNIIPININNKDIYEDNIKLKPLAHRLILNIADFWPVTPVFRNNLIIYNLKNVEVVNYNRNYYFLDSGHPGNLRSGYNYDLADKTNCPNIPIFSSINLYGEAGNPNIRDKESITGTGWKVGFGKIYLYNFFWDFDTIYKKEEYAKKSPVMWNTMAKIFNIEGAGIAIWSHVVTNGNLDYHTITNLCSLSESLWKYNPLHPPDNLNHATYRLYYHLKKLELSPYIVKNITSIYDGPVIDRFFPMGCIMNNKLDKELNSGFITQEYLDKYYPNWKMKIRCKYHGLLNNDLLVDINPDGAYGAKAIGILPLSARFIYGNNYQQPNCSEIYLRINPFLSEDIKKILEDENLAKNTNIARSNFASNHKYYSEDESTWFTDQRDSPLYLASIPPSLNFSACPPEKDFEYTIDSVVMYKNEAPCNIEIEKQQS